MALRTFFNIAGDWDLNSEQAMTLLGFDARTLSTYFKWKRDHGSGDGWIFTIGLFPRNSRSY